MGGDKKLFVKLAKLKLQMINAHEWMPHRTCPRFPQHAKNTKNRPDRIDCLELNPHALKLGVTIDPNKTVSVAVCEVQAICFIIPGTDVWRSHVVHARDLRLGHSSSE